MSTILLIIGLLILVALAGSLGTNPTQQVATESVPFDEEKVYWPANPTLTSDVTYTGEMMGMRFDTGYAEHFDDAFPKLFLGTKEQITSRFQSDTPATDFKYLIRRPKLFQMNLNSGTASIPANIGAPAYATDSGHVQMTTAGLNNNNLAGMVVDIGRSGSTGGSGAIGILSLATTTTPASVTVAPPVFGALVGMVVQGFLGADATAAATAGGAAGNMLITGGRGGNTTGTGASTGGAGGSLTITTGQGGNATAGTGNGGAAGNVAIVCQVGGTSAGGTAGTAGCVTINASSGTNAGGLVVGAATGGIAGQVAGNKGTGTVNVSVGVFLNGTAYTNPGFVFEKWITGNIARFADQPGAKEYDGPLSIEKMESYVRSHLELPGMDYGDDLFRRAAFTLVKLEEAWVALFDHEKKIKDHEARLALKGI